MSNAFAYPSDIGPPGGGAVGAVGLRMLDDDPAALELSQPDGDDDRAPDEARGNDENPSNAANRRGRRDSFRFAVSLVLIVIVVYAVALYAISQLSNEPYEGNPTTVESGLQMSNDEYNSTATTPSVLDEVEWTSAPPVAVDVANAAMRHEDEIYRSSAASRDANEERDPETTVNSLSTSTSDTTTAPTNDMITSPNVNVQAMLVAAQQALHPTVASEPPKSETSTKATVTSQFTTPETTTTTVASATPEATALPTSTASLSTDSTFIATSTTPPSTSESTTIDTSPKECTVPGWCTNFQDCYPFAPITELEVSSSSSSPPANEHCPNAIAISTSDLPLSIKGSTKNAAGDRNIQGCGMSRRSRGVWYRFTSEMATLMHVEYQQEQGDSRLSIFYGNSCGELTCSKYVRGSSRNSGAQHSFHASARRSYYFFLEGSAPEEYEFRVATYSGVCEEAQYAGGNLRDRNRQLRSSPAAFSRGLDAPSMFDSSSPQCGNDGLWYHFVGPGNLVQVAVLIDAEGPFSGNVSLYKGQCNTLVCMETAAIGEVSSLKYRGSRYNHIATFELHAERCEDYYMAYSGDWDTSLWDMTTFVETKSSNRLRSIVGRRVAGE